MHPARRDLIALGRQPAVPLGAPHQTSPEEATPRGTPWRPAAVIILFTASPGGPAPGARVLLIQRLPGLRDHPGQISCPGGRLESGEDARAAALRETDEEIGIPPQHIDLIAQLPPARVPVSGFEVHPFIGWTDVEPTGPRSAGEVHSVLPVDVGHLLDPAHRAWVQVQAHPRRTHGFALPTGWIWGFTGNLLDHVFTAVGWTRPWDGSRVHTLTWDQAVGRSQRGMR